MLKAEEWDLMDAMTQEESTNYLTDKINEGLDIVAPIQTNIKRILPQRRNQRTRNIRDSWVNY